MLPAEYLHGPPHPRGPGRRRFPQPTTAGRLVGSIGAMATIISAARRQRDQRSFLLQRAQPAMVGLIDGSLSTLAPIFAVAFATHQPRYAFLAGLAAALGAGVGEPFRKCHADTGAGTV